MTISSIDNEAHETVINEVGIDSLGNQNHIEIFGRRISKESRFLIYKLTSGASDNDEQGGIAAESVPKRTYSWYSYHGHPSKASARESLTLSSSDTMVFSIVNGSTTPSRENGLGS